MDRNYDIDSILAEIKQKKSAGTAQQRPVAQQPSAQYEDEDYAYEQPRPARRAAAPQRTPPPQYEDEDYAYEQPRPIRRAAAPQRTPPPQYEDEDYAYEQPRPIRRAAAPQRTPPQYEDEDYAYEQPRPARRAAAPQRTPQPQYEDEDYAYEQPRPTRKPAYVPRRVREDEYEPASAIYAVAGELPEDEPAPRPERAQRQPPQEDYPAQAPREESYAPPARRAAARTAPAQEAPDELMNKYGGISALGSDARRVSRTDRESIRNHFGSAPQAGQAEAPQRNSARAPVPEESVPVPKPQVKGGFRFHPDAEISTLEDNENESGFTRLDLPVTEHGSFDGNELDHTRDLPAGLKLDALDSDLQPAAATGEEEPQQDDPSEKMELEEFSSPMEASEVKEDLNVLRGSLMMRFVFSIVCELGLLYLGLTETLPIPIPEMISAAGAPRTYVILNLMLLIAATLLCHSTISNGVIGLFTLKANNDSLAAMAVLASVMQGVSLVLNPAALGSSDVHLYFAVAVLGLIFNTVGKMFTVGRITGNFRFISSGAQKYAVQMFGKRELAREFTWDMNIDEPHIAYSTKTGFAEEFITQSYADDTSDNIAKIAVPILFVGSVVVAVMSYVFNKNTFVSLSTFAAILGIAAPLTATIVGSMPQHKAYRSLSRCGAVLSGYNAVERFSETNVILAEASELFTSEEVLLHNIKTFEKNRIDEAILDASSVLCVCNGAVKNIFLRIIQGNMKMLKPVENLVYEDGMGVSAWVDGKRVLIGNSDLMKHHGIDTPSKDYEAKYRTEERDILYLANSGELTAMFVISYVANNEVDEALGELERKGISVVVKSVDPNLTAAKIARIYDLPEEMIRILPAKLHHDFDALNVEKPREKGYIIHNGTFLGFARAISAAAAVKVATNIGLIVQLVGMILGYTLITFFSFMGSMQQATMVTVLIYQLVWSLAVVLFAGLRRV